MRVSEKMRKEGKRMVMIGTVGAIVLPLPIVWAKIIKAGTEKVERSKIFDPEQLAETMCEMLDKHPELGPEFQEEFEACKNNDALTKSMVEDWFKKKDRKGDSEE